MSEFQSVELVLGSAVANGGTFTVGYPTGFNQGDFENGANHVFTAMGSKFRHSEDFTISFAQASATVTYNGTTTIPAQSKIFFQFGQEGRAGVDDIFGLAGPNDNSKPVVQTLYGDTVYVNLGAPVTADPNGILDDESATDSAQSYTSADFVAAFDGTLDVPRNLTATGTTGSDHVVTVTGTDAYGQTMVENLTLSGTNVISGVKAFKTVTGVAVAVGAASDTFDLGWGDVLGLPFYLNDEAEIIAEFEDGVHLNKEAGIQRVPFQIDQTDLLAGTNISVLSPVAGAISRLAVMAWKAVTTGGDLTMNINNVAVNGLTVTVADAAAVGDVDSDTPTAGHASTIVAVDDEMEILVDAAFATAGALTGFIEVATTSVLDGTLVAGLAKNTVSTATTADVRGTYDPTTAADGTVTFGILLASRDVSFLGNDQFIG